MSEWSEREPGNAAGAGAARALFWLAIYGTILVAWAALFFASRDLSALPLARWAEICRGAQEMQLAPLWAMWALMGAAMMLPTFVPSLRTYLDLPGSSVAGASALAAGYGTIWLAAALVAALSQKALSPEAPLSESGQITAGWATGGLLILAGSYQFSRLKASCLAKCRRPLTYFLGRWRPGAGRALNMGLELGALCLGCCWALMALAFVGGMTNLVWMGAATLLMTLEKLDIGHRITAPLGAILIGWGGAVLILAAL